MRLIVTYSVILDLSWSKKYNAFIWSNIEFYILNIVKAQTLFFYWSITYNIWFDISDIFQFKNEK